MTINIHDFGWVQDAVNLRALCDVVAVFDADSRKHREMVETLLPGLVAERDGRETMLRALRSNPLKIPYPLLVGTSFKLKKDARCNGIIQAAVKGQGMDFITDGPAENYVCWAHCFGFIAYDYADDTFRITESGKELSDTRGSGDTLSKREKELMIRAALSYPPVSRILNLLLEEDDAHLTKFEIGRQLGFTGENGFTSMPQTIFARSLLRADAGERATMKTLWEGEADAYARTIAGWLEKLGLIERVSKEISISPARKGTSETIGHAYMITPAGVAALRRAERNSQHQGIAKNICWEMLSVKNADKAYLRTRRARMIQYLSEHRNGVSVAEVQTYLKTMQFDENAATVQDDLKGLQNIGLAIEEKDGRFWFKDEINDFIIPPLRPPAKSEWAVEKEKIRAKLRHVPHGYLALIDIAYDGNANRLFELAILNLLMEECNYQGVHLGGGMRPDGIIYTTEDECEYGVIVCTKAYSKGYKIPAAQAREMQQYLEENQVRRKKVNPDKWWRDFPRNTTEFYFLFVAGHFVGKFQLQLERISKNKGVKGAAVSVANLLLCAEAFKAGTLTHGKIRKEMFNNTEFIMKGKG